MALRSIPFPLPLLAANGKRQAANDVIVTTRRFSFPFLQLLLHFVDDRFLEAIDSRSSGSRLRTGCTYRCVPKRGMESRLSFQPRTANIDRKSSVAHKMNSLTAHGYFIPVLEKIAWEGEFTLRSDP